MKRIGIDFGTTNTTLAYFDEKLQKPVGYKFKNSTEYISSAIAYHKVKGNISIASDAQSYRDNENYFFYEYYKIGLIQNRDAIVNKSHGKTYLDIVKDYLHKLITTYKEENLLGEGLLDVVALSVPNIVLSSSNTELRLELENFLKLEAKTAVLISEPACSTAYYGKIVRPGFEGNLVVVDYGGGTLDVSLCRLGVEESDGCVLPAISIIQQYSMDTNMVLSNGAGVAYCVAMVKELTRMKEDDVNFFPTVYEFEKILSSRDNINEGLREYYENGEDVSEDEEIPIRLNGENYIARCSLFDRVYNEVNKKVFDDALNMIIGGTSSSNLTDFNAFRILSVGGFSNLLCVNKAISSKLGTKIGRLREDTRIAQLSKSDKYYAVAYGAALYASKEVIKSAETTYSINTIVFDGKNEKKVKILPEHVNVDKYVTPQWAQSPFYIIKGCDAVIKIIIESENSQSAVEFQLDISDACINECLILVGIKILGDKTYVCVHNNLIKSVDEFEITQFINDFKNKR